MMMAFLIPRRGGYLGILCGTGTWHFLDVKFSKRNRIMDILFRHFMEL